MAKKKTKTQPKKKQVNAENVIGLHSEVTDQPITQTLEVNYMPYAMSVNVSRAFPEIDGFKPSHRKLLYTMYKMGLLKGERQKSANIVGQTMKLNPHGDAAIYETMVRLATGNEALLAPFVESKGNFGKYYSGDLSYAASRYTEAKLSPNQRRDFQGHRQGPGRLRRQLRRRHEGAAPAAHHVPQYPRLGQQGHRRRHGVRHLRL